MDDTLIPSTQKFLVERCNLWLKMMGIEPLRLGTVALIKNLKKDGHTIFIYTTSLRSTRKIWWTFFLYGIKPDKIINQQFHDKTLKGQVIKASKYPPAFGIDIHIDDSIGVAMEGQLYGFNTIILEATDEDWTNYVLIRVTELSE